MPNDKRKPVDATVDSITGAIGMLWDWLGGPEPIRDIVRDVRDESAKQPVVRDQRIPPEVIDTEGEEA